ncbi:transporter substrate-binding domain-containing protein [Alisedimentitalea sp. MJ-SS2]|uniref:substrate-binding periplasmic protein n=1 Tax=Aliisedimentitalea sp. MJ-SS2 TaxID=3049795 RepID=UPI00290FF9A3|nr:transporter substrate-binding domain-containing protein [Alisedimentitalea sp. MJ-SS2]MDU8926419.1 transporter substrate-binding domain-containing protein [Alisedimentitalea sp. MJ-SS2]
MSLTRRHALTLLGASLASPSLATTVEEPPMPTIRIATEGAFPPYNSLDKNGNLQGFEVDLGKAICAARGLSVIWVITDWATMIPDLLAGDFDVIMAGMAITPSRARQIAFGTEYFPSDDGATGMYVGAHTFQSPHGSLIAVQENTIHEDHLRTLGLRVETYATARKALDAVLDGAADITFGSPDYLEPLVYRTSRTLAILGTEVIEAGGAAAGFRKQDTTLRNQFNTGLAQLRSDGTLKRLNAKWFADNRDI